MSNNERFFSMLHQVPRISHLWNKERSIMHIDMVNREINVMSRGEAHMVRFFSSVWAHSNDLHNFDIVDAAASLDDHDLSLIIKWLQSPFYP